MQPSLQYSLSMLSINSTIQSYQEHYQRYPFPCRTQRQMKFYIGEEGDWCMAHIIGVFIFEGEIFTLAGSLQRKGGITNCCNLSQFLHSCSSFQKVSILWLAKLFCLKLFLSNGCFFWDICENLRGVRVQRRLCRNSLQSIELGSWCFRYWRSIFLQFRLIRFGLKKSQQSKLVHFSLSLLISPSKQSSTSPLMDLKLLTSSITKIWNSLLRMEVTKFLWLLAILSIGISLGRIQGKAYLIVRYNMDMRRQSDLADQLMFSYCRACKKNSQVNDLNAFVYPYLASTTSYNLKYSIPLSNLLYMQHPKFIYPTMTNSYSLSQGSTAFEWVANIFKILANLLRGSLSLSIQLRHMTEPLSLSPLRENTVCDFQARMMAAFMRCST